MPSAGPGRVPRAVARLIAGRRLATTLSAIGAAALVTGAVLATELPGSSRGASPRSAGSGLTIVQRRNLVATDTESGTLSYANPQTVFNRVSGTITSLPAIGQVIKPGQTLYRVDGSPVVLFNGTVPAYRDLSDGVTDGADVEQLKRNLIALGFDPEHTMTVNRIFDAATADAVDRWQGSLGETETGTVTLGRVVFLPGEQRITSVDTVLGSTGGSSSGGASGSTGSGASTSLTPLAPRAQFVSLTTTGAGSGSSTAAATSPGAKAAQTACPAPVASSPPGVTTSTTTTAMTTTTAAAPTTPARPGTSSTCGPAASNSATAPNTLIAASRRPPGSAKPGSRNPSQEAVLLALLKAETLQLRKTLSSSRSSTTGSGATRSSRGSTTTIGSGSGASSNGASSSSVSGSGPTSGGSSTGSATGTASAGSSAQAILQTTSKQLVVTVSLDATKQSEAVVGEPVSVQLPSGGTVDGRITKVSPIAQSSSSSSSSSSGAGGSSSSAPSATIPVTIRILGRHPVGGLDQAAVSVNFEQQVENNVLSVPVTALLATAGGGYAVQEAGAPHRLLAVTPGLFAAGYVQISGAEIYSGLQVTDSQG